MRVNHETQKTIIPGIECDLIVMTVPTTIGAVGTTKQSVRLREEIIRG